MKRSLAILALVLVAGCASNSYDETRDWGPERLYSAAREELDTKNYQKAIGYYQKLESRYPYGRYAQMAQIESAFAYWKDNENAQALAACERFIKMHPDHPNVDYAYYLKGRISFNDDMGIMGHLSVKDLTERDPRAAQDAFDAFRELVTRFPKSPYAPDAHARMNYLVNALASGEVNVAEYYLRRGAYVAAVNRAQFALTNYPRAPAVERALSVLARAYDKMGLKELRDDANRTLAANFPSTNAKSAEQRIGFFKASTKVKPAERGSWWELW